MNNHRDAVLVTDGAETAFSFTCSASLDISGAGRIRQRAVPAAAAGEGGGEAEAVPPAGNSAALFDSRTGREPPVKIKTYAW